MNASPPRLATWLLQRWGSGPQCESLVGDLIEQYQHGRSRAWYRRQVLTAIAVGAFRDIRDHKWLAVRAVLTASGFRLLELCVIGFVMRNVFHGFTWIMTLPTATRDPVLIAINGVIPAVGMGWVVGRLNRQHQAAMVLAVAALTLLPIAVPLLFPSQVPDLLRLVADALDDSRYVPALVARVESVIAVFVSVLLGGLSVPPDKRHRSSPSPSTLSNN